VAVARVDGRNVRLAIDADPAIKIMRDELIPGLPPFFDRPDAGPAAGLPR
jgi:hypothetical protein